MVFGLVALTLSIGSVARGLIAIRTAIAGGAIALIPFLFALNVYRIDFVAVGGDGTPASAPLPLAMALPLLPFLVCLLAGVIAQIRRRNSEAQPPSKNRQTSKIGAGRGP